MQQVRCEELGGFFFFFFFFFLLLCACSFLQSERPALAADQPVIKRGMLSAKAKNDEWKTRWCVLQGVTFGTFASASDKEPHKVVNMYGAKIELFKEPKRPFGIAVTTKAGVTYQMAAESETDQNDWAMRLADVAKHGTKSSYFSGSKRGARGTTSKGTSPSAIALSTRKVDETVTVALRKEVPAAAAAAAASRASGADKGSARKKMFASEEAGSAIDTQSAKKLFQSDDGIDSKESKSKQQSHSQPALEAIGSVPHKIMELYEKNKNKLLLGGIGKEEFSRNSEVILQVLSAEESIDKSAKRYNKIQALHLSVDDSSDDSDALEKPSPKEPVRTSGDKETFIFSFFLFLKRKKRSSWISPWI